MYIGAIIHVQNDLQVNAIDGISLEVSAPGALGREAMKVRQRDNDPTCQVLMCNGGVFGHKCCAPSFVRFVSTNKYSSKRSW